LISAARVFEYCDFWVKKDENCTLRVVMWWQSIIAGECGKSWLQMSESFLLDVKEFSLEGLAFRKRPAIIHCGIAFLLRRKNALDGLFGISRFLEI
jgi:hypothetical protein